MPPTTPRETIIPDRDGWYWAIRARRPESAGNLQLVHIEYGSVWVAGNEVEDRLEDWRFYAGPLEPPSLESAGARAMSDIVLQASSRILELLNERPMPLNDLAENLVEFYPPERIVRERTMAVLQHLEEEGLVMAAREQGKVIWRRDRTKPPLDGA